MITSIFNKAKKTSTLAAVASCLALTAGTVVAFAGIPAPPAGSGESAPTAVWGVKVNENSLLIYLQNDSNSYVGYTSSPPGCPTWIMTPETLKSYAAMSQAAVLSGKKIRISYNICRPSGPNGAESPTGFAFISGMEIFQNL
jgi:hypothetical protein